MSELLVIPLGIMALLICFERWEKFLNYLQLPQWVIGILVMGSPVAFITYAVIAY